MASSVWPWASLAASCSGLSRSEYTFSFAVLAECRQSVYVENLTISRSKYEDLRSQLAKALAWFGWRGVN